MAVDFYHIIIIVIADRNRNGFHRRVCVSFAKISTFSINSAKYNVKCGKKCPICTNVTKLYENWL